MRFFRRLFAWLGRYERHLSAAALLVGFATHNIFFERIDLWKTQIALIAYLSVCALSIWLLHLIESRAIHGFARPRWHTILPLATQFALGGFWSASLIYYSRSAAWSVSWPFVLLLAAIFLGNEYLRKYHSRLVFTNVLFFFALYAYAIFALPIVTHTLGDVTFLASGVLAVAVFAAFTGALRLSGRERFRADVWRIRFGVISVFVLMNLFYFTGVLPPLPLSARAAGIYHHVTRVTGGYTATNESEPWTVRILGLPPTMHVAQGESLYAYTAIFAPTALKTKIVHVWQWHDPKTGKWVTRLSIAYPIVGGRDGGYRGYSADAVLADGRWRVNVQTSDGRLLARIPFSVAHVVTPPPLTTELLNR